MAAASFSRTLRAALRAPGSVLPTIAGATPPQGPVPASARDRPFSCAVHPETHFTAALTRPPLRRHAPGCHASGHRTADGARPLRIMPLPTIFRAANPAPGFFVLGLFLSTDVFAVSFRLTPVLAGASGGQGRAGLAGSLVTRPPLRGRPGPKTTLTGPMLRR